MDAKTTAIVWIDPDNEFLEEEGKLHGAVKAVLDENRVIENINALNGKAHALGVQTFFVPIAFSDDYSEMGDDPQGIFGIVKGTGALKRGTWGTQVADCIDVREGNVTLEGKSAMCAFETTTLDEELKRRGITHVAVGGLLTNACVESTLRTAFDKGYTVYALTDCSATLSPDAHKASIDHNWPLFGEPVTHQAFLEKLDARS